MAHTALHKDAATTKASFQQVIAANDEVKHIYADNSGELQKAQTSGLIERVVKIVVLGTRAVLHMSGLGHEWWKEAMQAFC
eukprot:3379365-Pyramimonas_sp.AAC.1